MALTGKLKFIQHIDGEGATIQDVTPDYGIDDNPSRNSLALFLLYSDNNSKGVRTYKDVKTTLPLSQSEWEVLTDIMGWTQATMLRLLSWDIDQQYVQEQQDGQGIITTYASVVYYPLLNKVYKAIKDSFAIAPDSPEGAEYWEEVDDLFTLYQYQSVDQFSQDFQVDIKINTCITKQFVDIYSKCGCNAKINDLESAIKNWALYFSATVNFKNNAPEKMDVIIDELNKTCKTC